MNDILEGLFFPRNCISCRKILPRNQLYFCSSCEYFLPWTKFSAIQDNLIERIFWGIYQVQSGTSLLYYHKGGPVQELIHAFKYWDDKEVGYYLGRLMGHTLYLSQRYYDYDAILPVPLHPKKLKKRGYNQSQILAEPISSILKIPIINDALIRQETGKSQTLKDRTERYYQKNNPFAISDSSILENKRILIIDDILTTGATLSFCFSTLENTPGVKMGFATAGWTVLG